MYVSLYNFFLIVYFVIIIPLFCFLILEHSFLLLLLTQTEGKPGEKPWVNQKDYFSCWQVEIVLFRGYVYGIFWDNQLQVGLHHVIIDLSGLMYNLEPVL